MTDMQVQIMSDDTFNAERVDLIRRTIAPNLKKDEFELFIARCRQTNLDPVARQIYALSVWDGQVNDGKGGFKMSIQTSIDGMRLLAERSGKYAGQLGPLFCGKDRIWHEVWIEDEPPTAAKVGVLRTDFAQPLWSVAKYSEYAKRKKDGTLLAMWKNMPDLMLGKCAESLAVRRAFPHETKGLYTREEMQQAMRDEDAVDVPATVIVDSDASATSQGLTLESVIKFCDEVMGAGKFAAVRTYVLPPEEVGDIPNEMLSQAQLARIMTKLRESQIAKAKKNGAGGGR